MKNFLVKDLMVPVSEYATVPKGATLFEAVTALEKAQEEFDVEHNLYHHRAILILDYNQQVIGKLSQLGVLRALLPRDESIRRIEDISRFGFSPKLVNNLQERYRLEAGIMEDVYKKAARMKVEDYMQTPSEGEYVEENAPLDTAVHQLVQGTHLSLLVTREGKIVGILRLSDVFAAIFHVMKDSELSS